MKEAWKCISTQIRVEKEIAHHTWNRTFPYSSSIVLFAFIWFHVAQQHLTSCRLYNSYNVSYPIPVDAIPFERKMENHKMNGIDSVSQIHLWWNMSTDQSASKRFWIISICFYSMCLCLTPFHQNSNKQFQIHLTIKVKIIGFQIGIDSTTTQICRFICSHTGLTFTA